MEDRLSRWLALIEDREERPRIIDEMQSVGADTAIALLAAKLADPDMEIRCAAILPLLFLDAGRTIDLVLSMLNDPEVTVRWHACGCLHDFGDERAVGPLISVLAGDPDPQVRGTAAYALGGIGNPAAIPTLLKALDTDHEFDELGHSTSSSAATALDDILGTDETRIRVSDSLRQIRPGKPDLDLLRHRATELFRRWSDGGA